MTDIVPPCGLPLNPTAQQVFDRVAIHLLTQKERSGSRDGSCYYRSGPLSCAVGCLIPDEVYSVMLEGIGVLNLPEKSDWFGQAGLLAHTRLLQDLQDLHDKRCPTQWREQLKQLADKLDLSTAALPQEAADV